ncbi:conjugal transfer protein TraF [Marinomonas transparens]|uniref:Conjugal transfer protein TraF n=1 Tax=Marinomonas transparens TaxID=2795388 RepID=A0A934JTR6_9GAMM|nr:conjugal transfer protein TraF [Marinomonas transparens]MBJ7536892.1 conjugal transfer protein TraF [Marinomonas transparens]
MKKTLIFTTSLLSSAVMAAMPVYQPIGSSFTLGSSVNQRALATASANPAAPFLMVNEQDDDNFRFGIIGPIGIGVEMGDISDLGDRVEEIEDIVDINYLNAISGATSQSDAIAKAKTAANNAASKVDAILDDIAEDAYVKTSISTQVPFMPIIYKTKDNGAFMLDASVSAVVRGSLISGDVTTDFTDLTDIQVTTNSSFYAQTAVDLNVGFGYSREVWKPAEDLGRLIGGVKANVHQISLGRALVALDDDNVEVEDALSDAASDDSVSSTGVGLDLGAIWVADNYHVGITLANINEPEFDGVALGQNCASSDRSCNVANGFITSGELEQKSAYTMEMQTTIEASVTSKNKSWTLAGSYDANSVKDPVGDEYQWGAVSVSYYGDSHFLPGLRAGYRQNMAGTELSYVSAGLTLLKRLNLDVAVATETVTDEDGDEVPRSAYISLGYGTAF